MKDENIKEILNKWKCYIELTKKFTTNEYEMLRVEDIDKILDYITNLQEENERLKEKTHNQKVANAYEIVQIDKLQTNIKTQIRRRKKEAQLKRQYKARIDKAIEEIKKRSTKEVADLYINLLQGKSDG